MFLSREINENMSEMAWENMHGKSIGRLRFFKPTDKFWVDLKSIKEAYGIKMFIDCGTGNGDLPKEAREKHSIKMGGLDIVHREGNGPVEVQITPAHRLPLPKDVWRMACRPDHSGWIQGLIEMTHEEDNGFIYVGLKKNMSHDLGKYLLDSKYDTFEDIGEDGEQMLVFPK